MPSSLYVSKSKVLLMFTTVSGLLCHSKTKASVASPRFHLLIIHIKRLCPEAQAQEGRVLCNEAYRNPGGLFFGCIQPPVGGLSEQSTQPQLIISDHVNSVSQTTDYRVNPVGLVLPLKE